ncbi:hypothetical protein [Xanthomonas albilineans]|uniref:hypothetical protein n=1 Tax=Xanthomonas albilineans TaxID=29447 RepID=UPI0005F33EF3|nr:hypothetical protein [Xanthomonas albilineans]PPU93848.1 hypothetical protein XalbCFBP2523_05260 [Xanthomonas albilineans]
MASIDTSLPSVGSAPNPFATATTNPFGNTVQASNDTAAVQQAVSLSSDASVILSLGTSSPAEQGLTYTAAGLFNTIVSAGSADGTSPDLNQNQANQSYSQGILDGIGNPPSTPGIYNASGVFTGQNTLTPALSSALKENPNLTGAVVGDLLNQGIVGGLISTTA